jgi:hypothetical protein
MRKVTPALTGLAAAALAVGMAGPALAADRARPKGRVPAQAAFRPGCGRPVIDWNRELISAACPQRPRSKPAQGGRA